MALESLQLNSKTRIDANAKFLTTCKDCVPAIFSITVPLRSFNERDLSMAKVGEVIDGFPNAKGVVDGNSRAPYWRAIGADRHGWNSRRFARRRIDQQQAFGAAVAEGLNVPV